MLARFADVLVSSGAFMQGQMLPEELQLAQAEGLGIYYSPFDYINRDAKVVLVGITPGLQQAVNALNAARQALRNGLPPAEAARLAKLTGSFSGPLRQNLVAMLDHIGLPGLLGLKSCTSFFTTEQALVHSTSMLRYPVFLNGKDYNGTPPVLRHPLLKAQLSHFMEELAELPRSVIVPLGPKVQEVVAWLAGQGVIDEGRVLSGMPHPSGANAERIAYFLGRKPKAQLSARTNADLIDQAKAGLLTKIAGLNYLF